MRFEQIKRDEVYKFIDIPIYHKRHQQLYGEVKSIDVFRNGIGVKFADLEDNKYCEDGLYWYYSYGGHFNFVHEAEPHMIEYLYPKIDEKMEENKMSDILKIYKDKQTRKITGETVQKRDEAIKSDKAYSHLSELSAKYGFYMPSTDAFEGLQEKLDAINAEEDIRLSGLEDLIAEVQAQLALCENYDQKIAVLKNYNVLDENGKVRG